VLCPSCHADNADDARFCSSCGRPLAHADHTASIPSITIAKVDPLQDAIGPEDDTVVTLSDLSPGTGVLVVRSHPQAGSRFVLADLTRLGRHPDSEISLDDITVSRRHAEIVRQGEDFVVADTGSLNGTYVNNQRIDGPIELHSGDDLQVGKFRLVFLVAQ
jgi:pSer/pThr/pTyr-binding forkhead associated (FHA) protein